MINNVKRSENQMEMVRTGLHYRIYVKVHADAICTQQTDYITSDRGMDRVESTGSEARIEPENAGASRSSSDGDDRND